MKICLQGADFETNNQGVSALAMGSIQAILHKFPGADIFILNYGKSAKTYSIRIAGREVSVPFVNMRFSWRFWLSNNIAFLLFLSVLIKLIPFESLRNRLIAGNVILHHLYESKLAMAISGGDSFSDIYGITVLVYVSLPQILALWAGIPLILLPQTLGPFKSRFARSMARYIMKRASAIYSRDREGLRIGSAILNVNGSASKVRFCYDVGFLLEAIPPEKVDVVGLCWPPSPGPATVGVNISGLLSMGGHTRDNMFGLNLNYSQFAYALIEFLLRQKNARVLLIPHVFGGSQCDSAVSREIYDRFKDQYAGNIGFVRGKYNQNEIKYIIRFCDFFIGSRMHACIAAISQSIPAVPLAYSDKFAGVMESVGAGSAVLDARNMGEDEIIRAVGKAFDVRGEMRRRLSERIPQVRKMILGLFSDIQGPVA